VKYLIIIIPAYQPDHRLLKLIGEIKEKSDFDILIVNDGSNDRCTPIFDMAITIGCTVLNHKKNYGKGAALKTAFSYLLEAGSQEGFVCADCDGQHTWPDINKLAMDIPYHPTSIILGSRKFVGKVPLKSRFGNYLTGAIFNLLTGNKIGDTQTGLRGFSARMLPWLTELDGNHYEYEMNQLLEAKKAGYTFHCIPIETIYENNNQGSHFNPILDSIRVYLPILKFSISSMACGLIDFALLFLFKRITDDLLIAVVGARVISSLSNYLLNKHLVFEAKQKKRNVTLLLYYLLVVLIMTCNYLLLTLFHERFAISLFISKLMTEVLLFIVSYTVQHRIIFRNKDKV
jgi:putative flippase GtrA